VSVIVQVDELPLSVTGLARRFEGDDHGGAPVSFFLMEARPGEGPGMHSHPYAEVFVVQEGRVTFTLGEEQVELEAGAIVVVPAGVPHLFRNTGEGPLRQVNIHGAGRIVTDWVV
jgi:mannose-6-phosphate isomerase-like protein (cupin superfamily)